MIEVSFYNKDEIGMGSPYNRCDLTLKGSWVPKLPDKSWQDLHAYSDDKKQLALVYWNHDTDSNPGFNVVTIDVGEKTISTSSRQAGCCDKLWWDKKKGFLWDIGPSKTLWQR